MTVIVIFMAPMPNLIETVSWTWQQVLCMQHIQRTWGLASLTCSWQICRDCTMLACKHELRSPRNVFYYTSFMALRIQAVVRAQEGPTRYWRDFLDLEFLDFLYGGHLVCIHQYIQIHRIFATDWVWILTCTIAWIFTSLLLKNKRNQNE